MKKAARGSGLCRSSPIDKGPQNLSKALPQQPVRPPSDLASATGPAWSVRVGSVLIEELSQFLRHGAAELLGVDDRHGATIIARHVMADADRDELDRRAGLDLLDHITQVALEIVAGIHGKR